MKQLKITLLILFSFLPSSLDAGALDDARFFEKIYLGAAIRVETIPTAKIGTGFFTKLEGEPNRLMLTTNKHMVEGADELQLTVPTTDSSRAVTGTVCFKVPLVRDTVKLYHIPQDDIDLALLIVDKESMTEPGKESNILHFCSLPFRYYTNVDSLFAGQAVLFSGYPLGLSVNKTKPLLRKGSIAGIDTTRDIIYLDADAFGGSSGSPVFIDFSSQANVEFFQTYKQMLVGMISGYLFEKRPLSSNSKTKNVRMVQEENTGIAVVIPAETIRKEAESFLAKQR